MSAETWLAYLAACIVLTIIPGPSVLLVVARALTYGKKAALMCVLGTMTGSLALMALSFAGVGAILATSALLFQIVKWAGVFYLAWLGFRQMAAARGEAAETPPIEGQTTSSGSFWAGTLTAVLNPKSIIFYAAFLAQFIDPQGDMPLQLAMLAMTSGLVVVTVLGVYALIAARARRLFESPRVRRRAGYAGGGFMLGGSALMAVTR